MTEVLVFKFLALRNWHRPDGVPKKTADLGGPSEKGQTFLALHNEGSLVRQAMGVNKEKALCYRHISEIASYKKRSLMLRQTVGGRLKRQAKTSSHRMKKPLPGYFSMHFGGKKGSIAGKTKRDYQEKRG